jgi:cysteinyl-tRNA synthetase
MDLTLYNTESRTKEPFRPEGKEVTLYTCGPTVYSYAHIGNLRTFVFEDLLRRTLLYFGHEVQQVMNLTDVDDKTIRGATAADVSLDTFTEPFKKAFFEDLASLRVEKVEHYPQATDYIPQMIAIIEKLIDQGHAYKGADGSVYFSIAHFPRYGCLSHLKLDELQTGASDRVDSDEYDKDNPSDFVLWKGYDAERDGKIYWDSPFGKGRPGWHLECSCMAMQLLGKTVDIHCGGVDNIFPHHENEIAQSEAYSGERFVRHWLHAEHLIVEGKKMSKSLGNFYTLRDLTAKGYSGVELRYMLLHTHYRQQLNFTFEELHGVRSSLDRLHALVRRLKEADGEGSLQEPLRQAEQTFKESLADDLNISAALATLFDFAREANGLIDAGKVSREAAAQALATLERFDSVLGVIAEEEETIPQEALEKLQQRLDARKAKDWARADLLRDEISAMGFVIEDSSGASRLKKA